MFPSMRVFHIDFHKSDHRVIQISLNFFDNGDTKNMGHCGFRFEPWWIKDKECMLIVNEAWRSFFFDGLGSSFARGLEGCANELGME